MSDLEIESLTEFDEVAATGSLGGHVLQSLDLTGRADALKRCRVSGAMFLGCVLTSASAASLRDRGALIFPVLPDVPMNPYRAELYTGAELYQALPAGRYEDCLDARVYAWVSGAATPPPLDFTLATALHDHAIDDALAEHLDRTDAHAIVGVMGGHAAQRGEPGYAQAVDLGRRLTRAGFLVASGGGPGAMEAANLGAWLAERRDADVAAAIAAVARVPSFRPSVDEWARTAFDVRDRWPDGGASVGIPTWFYGHEPPNIFATAIAKYFSNALREDTLLRHCRGGIVYLPGAAGTVQELFQAVTGNYYATDPSQIAPLVLIGTRHWSETVPAWPLLRRLAGDRAMAERIHLVDDVGAALDVLTRASS